MKRQSTVFLFGIGFVAGFIVCSVVITSTGPVSKPLTHTSSQKLSSDSKTLATPLAVESLAPESARLLSGYFSLLATPTIEENSAAETGSNTDDLFVGFFPRQTRRTAQQRALDLYRTVNRRMVIRAPSVPVRVANATGPGHETDGMRPRGLHLIDTRPQPQIDFRDTQ